MQRWCWLLFIVIFATQGIAGVKVYKSVDGDGNVVFSDSPGNNAEEITLQPTQTYRVSEIPERAPVDDLPSEDNDRQAYETITIVQPSPEETIWDNQGNLSVAVSVVPGLQSGDTLEIFIDDKKQGQSQEATMVQLTGILRGEHRVFAQIVDGSGNIIASSEPVIFFLHKASRL